MSVCGACFAPVFCCKQLNLIGNLFNGNAFEVRLWKKLLSTCMSHAVKDTFEMHSFMRSMLFPEVQCHSVNPYVYIIS